MPFATYAITLEAATDLIQQLALSPFHTHIEPSRYAGYLFDDLRSATAFRLRFDAERLAYDDEEHFLMFALADQEIEPWLRSCGGEFERVEFVAVQFASDGDRAQFEAML